MAVLSVSTNPPGLEGRLSFGLKDLENCGNDMGTLEIVSWPVGEPMLWLYSSPVESAADKHPLRKKLAIEIACDDNNKSTVSVYVWPVFAYLTRPPVVTILVGSSGAGEQHRRALEWIKAKYGNCVYIWGNIDEWKLADTGSVWCPCPVTGKACTSGSPQEGYFDIRFGLASFQNENIAASTLVHEMGHAEGLWPFPALECTPLTREWVGAGCTGLSATEIEEIERLMSQEECDPP